MKQKMFFRTIILTAIISFLLCACKPAAEPTIAQIEPAVESATEVPVKATEILPTVIDKEAVILNEENASAGDTYIPDIGNRGYDVQQYHLNITLDPGTYWVEGLMSIDLTSTQDNLLQISFDLVDLNVSEVLIDGDPADQYFLLKKKLFVDFVEPADKGSAHTIAIKYNGKPVQEQSDYVPFIDNLGIQFRENMLYVISEPDGARYWMPVNDHPRDKAGYHMEITVPEKFVAVSNGVLNETIENGNTTTYIWDNEEPIASALVTIAVGEYQRVDGKSPNGIPLRSYVTKQSVDEFTDMQPLIGEMIDWMGEQFGTYPFTEFGYVEVSDIGASLETQSMVIMSERSLFIESVLSHEMSHMWFGDWVNLDSWSEVWRNEGFATYIALMWKYRDNKAGLDEYMQEVDDVINDTSSGFPLNNPPAEEMFGRDSYDKGALLVHNLRNEIGDEAFFTGLQNYFNQYGGGSASDAQFQDIMEEAAGVSLDSFFTEWFTE